MTLVRIPGYNPAHDGASLRQDAWARQRLRRVRCAPHAARARWRARARHCRQATGVGCDQVIVVEPPRNGGTDAYLRFWNQDGGEVAACGNGTRCAARLLLDETEQTSMILETDAGWLTAEEAGGGQVRVDMGPARLDWRDIPLARAADTLHVAVGAGPLGDAVAVNMGNPHAVFFVDDADAVPLEALGPGLEIDPLFPEHANIGVAQRLADDRLRLRVWERGAGLTQACGTGACAAAVAGARRGLTGRSVTVVLDGGELGILWREDGHVEMTGPTAASFSGVLPG
ncbi:Diaminopimelate epimerase [Geodia barretti]|uniref:diaminopimelate epimerase n=3 Tax=Geodia barretti TaxID=519541 RepID=A0AA35T0X2_GEOBA|nr:Diaminopimelate epimerase [Geodia barretti]